MKKCYYWIKLKKDFFNSIEIEYLLDLSGGKDYVVIYLMLLLKSIDTNGYLGSYINGVMHRYSITQLSRFCPYFEEEVINNAIDTFLSIGLLVKDDKELVLKFKNYSELIKSETNYAIEKRKQRALALTKKQK